MHLFKLNSRRAISVARRLLGDERAKVSRHSHAGNNALFVVSTERTQLLIKQLADPWAMEAEVSAQKLCSGAGYYAKPLFISEELGIVVSEFSLSDRNFDDLAKKSSGEVLSRIVHLAGLYFVNPRVLTYRSMRRLERFVDGPIPTDIRQHDYSPALRELYRLLLERPASTLESFNSYAGDFEGSHGDIKLDNLVAKGPRNVLVDWERLCVGPVGWDLAGFAAAAFIACTRQIAGADASVGNAADFTGAIAASWLLLGLYNQHLSAVGMPPLSNSTFRWMLAHYLLERVCSEASFKAELGPMDYVLLDVIDAVTQGLVFGDA